MTWSEALNFLHKGMGVRRPGWDRSFLFIHEDIIWVCLQSNGQMKFPWNEASGYKMDEGRTDWIIFDTSGHDDQVASAKSNVSASKSEKIPDADEFERSVRRRTNENLRSIFE